MRRCLAIPAGLTTALLAGWIGPSGAQTAVSPQSASPPAAVRPQAHRPASALKEGDVVKLRSGGTQMIVRTIEGSEAVCEWLTAAGVLQTGRFPFALLRRLRGPGYGMSPIEKTGPRPTKPSPRPCPAAVSIHGHNECLG